MKVNGLDAGELQFGGSHYRATRITVPFVCFFPVVKASTKLQVELYLNCNTCNNIVEYGTLGNFHVIYINCTSYWP